MGITTEFYRALKAIFCVLLASFSLHASGQSHEVAPGEGLFGIARLYGISVEALTAANPESAASLQPGDWLVIPQPVVLPDLTLPREVTVVLTDSLDDPAREPAMVCGDTLRILALMPLAYDADTIAGGGYPRKVTRLREISLEFIHGAEWAADELREAGRHVVLHVEDEVPDSSGLIVWEISDADRAHLVLGPLQRAHLDSARRLVAATETPHWFLTKQPGTMLLGAPNSFQPQPVEEAALTMLGDSVAGFLRTFGLADRAVVLTAGGKAAAAERAFMRAYHAAVLPGDSCALRIVEATPQFAENIGQYLNPLARNLISIPGGDEVKSMVAHVQVQLQQADTIPVDLWMHPDAAGYEFLDWSTISRTGLTLPTADWMAWGDSAVVGRVELYRARFGTDPSAYAMLAHDAVLESATWCPVVPGLPACPAPLGQQFDWSATGPESGFVNRAWRIVTIK